jgi:phytoene dehydrogenase-like protein
MGSALHGDVPPWEPGSAITAVYLDLLGHTVGWPSPRGGAGKLAEALVQYLRQLGGEIRLGVPVERVLTSRSGDAVRGVRAGDEDVPAGTVIADVMPRELLRLGGEALAPRYRRRLQCYTYGARTIKMDWALSAPIPWTAREARQAGTVHVGGTPAEILHSIRQQLSGELPRQPFLLLGQQSLADPTRAPAGQHTAWAYTHVLSAIAWEREAVVERIEQQVERFAPGFRDRILARHTLMPEELEQQNRNLIGGDVGGGSYRLDQLIFRPLPSLWPYRTPLRGLYLGSAATFPGGGVHGVCGYAAARLALPGTWIRRFW